MEKSDEDCIDSISYNPSSLVKASRICGRRETNATRIKGANIANNSPNTGLFSTGSLRNGNVAVNDSTFERDATNVTGMVQKIHNVTVSIRLRSSPTVTKDYGERAC